MKRIRPPAFAPAHARQEMVRFYDGINLAEYQDMQQRKEVIDRAIQQAVEEHVARCALAEEDSFPCRARLSGDYYLEARESYGYAGKPQGISVSVQARCLGWLRAGQPGETEDYLGINIVLLFDPRNQTFSTFYTGSQVI